MILKTPDHQFLWWFFILHGGTMNIGTDLEKIRKLRNMSIVDVCNVMGVSESEYIRLITNKKHPTTYQLIMFICVTCHPLPTI